MPSTHYITKKIIKSPRCEEAEFYYLKEYLNEKVFSIFLVFTNLFLSKSLTCLAKPDEKVTSKKVVTLEKKKKKAEEKQKVEEDAEAEDEVEHHKKNTISLEISDETIEKIKEMLNSETNENYAKARLTIDAIFSVILGVNLLCSLKERFFLRQNQ